MAKRYLITTAVPGAATNTRFLSAIEESYCKHNKAELIILVSQRIYKEDELDSRVPQEKLVFNDMRLNDKLRISTIPINPQAIDPVTGLDRQGQRDGSFIFASTKQRMKVVANSNNKLPHVLMTTGAITKPYYRDTRNGIIATKDHVNGAIIVEVVSNTEYHYRQVQADNNGSFIDLGVQYNPDGTKAVALTEAIIPGDWHAGSTDPKVKRVVFDLIRQLDPKHVVLHDLFDGESINPHTVHNLILRARMGDKASLVKELEITFNEVRDFALAARNVCIVRSNHDIFLDRYVEEGRYLHDERNHIIGLELALAKAHGNDPLKWAITRLADKAGMKLSNVRFLKMDEDFKLTPKRIQCGAHGHLGSNGARGSISNLELAYGASITGHSHSPSILRNAWAMGTSTHLQLGYNKGPSSWLQTMCLLYANGSRQLINVLDGKYKL
jgi:hypothetical protein